MTDILPGAVYLLCFLTSAACALLLARAYRRSGARLLLWSAACFCFLALNNLTLMIDLLVLREMDLRVLRHGLALAAVAVLLFGFIWDVED
ncbi:MAG TPA: DUF5985 family protein [Allosphingosinicella sp.]